MSYVDLQRNNYSKFPLINRWGGNLISSRRRQVISKVEEQLVTGFKIYPSKPGLYVWSRHGIKHREHYMQIILHILIIERNRKFVLGPCSCRSIPRQNKNITTQAASTRWTALLYLSIDYRLCKVAHVSMNEIRYV